MKGQSPTKNVKNVNLNGNEGMNGLNTMGLPKLDGNYGMLKRVKSSPVVSPKQTPRNDNLTGLVLLNEPSAAQEMESPFSHNGSSGMGAFGLPPPNDDDDEGDDSDEGVFVRSGTLTESIISDITVDQVQQRRKQSQRTPK